VSITLGQHKDFDSLALTPWLSIPPPAFSFQPDVQGAYDMRPDFVKLLPEPNQLHVEYFLMVANKPLVRTYQLFEVPQYLLNFSWEIMNFFMSVFLHTPTN
jgi:hypothetical protein